MTTRLGPSRRFATLLIGPIVALAACSGDTTETADAHSGTDYLASYTLVDEDFGTMVTVTVEESTRTIVSNALPDHDTGDFPNGGNPNTISAQDNTWLFPLEPTLTGEAEEVRMPGVALNGVKFEPGTAETVTCESGDVYRIEAVQEVYDLGLDFNNAHVQPTGEYHYHGISQLLVDGYDREDDLVLIGFAADGHLIYYSKSGAYASGYELGSEVRNGSECVASGRTRSPVEIDGSMPDGTYSSDWVFDGANGDLDECNGITLDGEYLYLITEDYPYISRCVMGDVSNVAGVGQRPPGQRNG